MNVYVYIHTFMSWNFRTERIIEIIAGIYTGVEDSFGWDFETSSRSILELRKTYYNWLVL